VISKIELKIYKTVEKVMKFKIFYCVLFLAILSVSLLFSSFSSKPNTSTYNTRDILNKILEATANIKTLRYDLLRNERIKGRMSYTESQVKLQVSPRKIYLSMHGPEVLWIEGTNTGEALVNPGTFPYFNLNLDPMGSLMRKNQHHTLNEIGIQYLADILKDGIKRAGDNINKYFIITGEEIRDGRPCYKLSITFPDFGWEQYTVEKGENITTIARKLHVSEYMILENNPKYSWYNDVKPNQIIKVPNAFARLIMMSIDKEWFFPVSTNVFDDKGLFETYDYKNLKINSVISPEEFTKGYQGYHF
jgi:outer membrane lipoprotein-sorting protein